MYQKNPTKVLTGEVRLSYCHLDKPYASISNPGNTPKYSVTLLIPKTDTATKADIDSSIAAAAEAAVKSKWNGVKPPVIQPIVHDGDGVRQDGTKYGDECRGCWVLTASSTTKPQVVSLDNIRSELAPQDVYSGMYARVTVNFFGYAKSGKKAVACGLGNVLKTRDGEPLFGGASAESDFGGLASAGGDIDIITGKKI